MSYAQEWDQAHQRRLMIANRVDRRLAKFVDDTKLPRGTRWLDVGCGTGINCRYLASCGFFVTGIDSSRAAIGRARSLPADPEFCHQIDYQCQRAEMMHLVRRSYDAAIDVRSLENLNNDEVDIALAQVFDKLRPGGWFFSITASVDRDDMLTAVGRVRKEGEDSYCRRLMRIGFEQIRGGPSTVTENGKTVDDIVVTARVPGGER